MNALNPGHFIGQRSLGAKTSYGSILRSCPEGRDPGGNGLVAVLDPSAFGEDFAVEVDRLCVAVKGLPPAAGLNGVCLPGEPGFESMARRSRDGIPLVQGTRSRLLARASKLNVVAPEGLA
jgi:ureidoglycolate dehydrogenase (NAD+)